MIKQTQKLLTKSRTQKPSKKV